MKYIDIHSHVNFKAFDEDREEVIKRALFNDTWVINVGTQVDTSRSAVELANKYKEGVYAIVGLHPIHTSASHHDEAELGAGGDEFTSRGEVFDKDAYRELLKDPKTVGIGECGLDYFHMTKGGVRKQKKAFIEQIELANETKKPLMLHIRSGKKDFTSLNKEDFLQDLVDDGEGRNAYQDALTILKKYLDEVALPSGRRGNVHFFAGSEEDAKAFLDFGFTLSFTGVITFTHDYDEVIKNTPLDMIMVETDSPYVAPVPYRGKRNEPAHVKEIVRRIAEIKELHESEVALAVVANSKRVFGI
ncbi:MAG: TatD family hydrolase [bacterium]|nr:TatD family hydrolase [bacterium]